MAKYCRTRSSALEKGCSRYMTGLPCKRGHLSPRHTSTRRCVECDRVNKLDRERSITERTPIWANLNLMKYIYRLSGILGTGVHVDHEIPLNGETDSGLHVPENMVIMDSWANMFKSNNYKVT